MPSLFPPFLALELTRDARRGTERAACYEFPTEEARASWLAAGPAWALRQRIDESHPAARGARLTVDVPGASRPVLVLQPSPGPRARAPRADRPEPKPEPLTLF